MKLWIKILIALLLGIAAGAIIGPGAELLKPVGTVFLNLITMVIVPLVFSSMAVGVTSIDPQKLGRIGSKTLFLYFFTTLIAIVFGLSFSYFFRPGDAMQLSSQTSIAFEVPPTPSLSSVLLSLIPVNPIAAFVEGNVLQIIVFAIFIGISINIAGEKGKPLLELLESLSDVMYRLTTIIMEFSPFAVFSIMAWVAGSFGLMVLLPLLKFLATYYVACAFHVLVVFYGILYFFAKLSPKPFFRGMSDAIMVAFSTCSSAATLPVSMHCVQRNLGVSKNIASFVLPLGSTINMNGTAIFQAMSALFVAQAYDIGLEWHSIVTIVVTALMSAVGAAGIPGTGFIMLSVVFTSVGLPLEGLALLAGIDRVREMVSTVLNILGDAVCAVYVAKQEGELDERQYNNENLVGLEGSEI